MTWRDSLFFVLLSAGLAACAPGSGSSGFDLSPAAEDALIDDALDTRGCVDDANITVCPALEGVPTIPTPSQTPATAPEQIGVNVTRDPIDSLMCDPDGSCTQSIDLVLSRLPEGATVQLAVRLPNGEIGWQLSIATPAPPTGTTTTTVRVPMRAEGTQIAILIFLDGEASAPGLVETLSSTGADVIFVTP